MLWKEGRKCILTISFETFEQGAPQFLGNPYVEFWQPSPGVFERLAGYVSSKSLEIYKLGQQLFKSHGPAVHSR